MKSSLFVAVQLAVFCSIHSENIHAQQTDSLVRFNEISFSSAAERNAFLAVQAGKPDYFHLFLANGNLLTDSKMEKSKTDFYEHVKTISVADIKKNEKKIKTIYDNLHKKYLKKFEIRGRFEQLFHNGYFNSFSASALFALTLDELKIPYQINEVADQAYLVAYPATDKIIIKNVSELAGYFALSDEFKKEYIKRLNDQKLIDPKEYASSSLNDLFDKYYFGQGGEITLAKLAGLSYMNEALFLSNEKRFEESYAYLQKAYVLYPSDRMGYLLAQSAAYSLDTHTAKDSVQALKLGRVSRYVSFGINNELIPGNFQHIIQVLLFEQGSKSKLDIYHRVLSRNIADEKIRAEIDYAYSFHVARYYYSQARYIDALPLLEKALTLKPKEVDVQTLFIVSQAQRMDRQPLEDGIRQLDEYGFRFPELGSNNGFAVLNARACLLMFYRNYQEGKAAEGDKYKLKFEALVDRSKDLSIENNLIGQAYSEAAVYYFRKGQVSKAKQYIVTGLKYAPQNYELRERQRAIK
jgi:tetratricopeptide (TPR) repeat protein